MLWSVSTINVPYVKPKSKDSSLCAMSASTLIIFNNFVFNIDDYSLN